MLGDLGFSVSGEGGLHRTWHRKLPSGIVLRITLVQSGPGPVKAGYVKAMRKLLLGSAEIRDEVHRDE